MSLHGIVSAAGAGRLLSKLSIFSGAEEDSFVVHLDELTTAVTTIVVINNIRRVIYSIIGGADRTSFTLDSATGVLEFVTPPVFDTPTDTDVDGTYEVLVQADDGFSADTQLIYAVVDSISQSLDATLFVDADAFFTHVIEDQVLDLGLYVDTDTFYTHDVDGGDRLLTQSASFTDTDTFFAPVVTGWKTSWSQALNITSLSWNGFTLRQVIPASLITISGSLVRVTIEAGGTEGCAIDALYIGHAAAAGDAYDFDGNQVRCQSVGSNSFTVAAGTSLLLDEVAFALDETKNIIIAAHFNDAAHDNIGGRAIASYTAYFKTANEAGTTDVTGYSNTASALRLVNKIEVFA